MMTFVRYFLAFSFIGVMCLIPMVISLNAWNKQLQNRLIETSIETMDLRRRVLELEARCPE